ncbi:hypothetical protein GCM10027403_01750 [Arthrobacter tecti]
MTQHKWWKGTASELRSVANDSRLQAATREGNNLEPRSLLDAATLRGAATVVGARSHVLNGADLEACGLK